jgi:competence protein ComEC
VDIDVLVLTHADGDHIAGLIPIIKRPQIKVKRILHSGISTFQPGTYQTMLGNKASSGGVTYLTTRQSALSQFPDQKLSTQFKDWCHAIGAKLPPITYEAVSSTTPPIDLGDPLVGLEVLGPILESVSGQAAYRWLEDEPHTINGHSVVLRLIYGNICVLLAGDINTKGAKLLLGSPGIPTRLGAHVFKVPHHGSQDFDPAFLAAVRPQVSVVSSGDEPDHGHPRANLLGAIGKACRSDEPLLFSTEIAATFVESNVPPAPGDSVGATGSANGDQRRLFKRSLNGMINVRSDGSNLFAARRVKAGYWWEAYGPIPAAP